MRFICSRDTKVSKHDSPPQREVFAMEGGFDSWGLQDKYCDGTSLLRERGGRGGQEGEGEGTGVILTAVCCSVYPLSSPSKLHRTLCHCKLKGQVRGLTGQTVNIFFLPQLIDFFSDSSRPWPFLLRNSGQSQRRSNKDGLRMSGSRWPSKTCS